jgi:hypothetical protein
VDPRYLLTQTHETKFRAVCRGQDLIDFPTICADELYHSPHYAEKTCPDYRRDARAGP